MTNATKANIIAVVNAVLVLVTSFGVDVTDEQQAAITGAVNAILVAWVGLTFKNSTKRIKEG